ncbi:MAG: response regulator [Caldithrix sp.]|nr:response regulator [Caldithrix sp.]
MKRIMVIEDDKHLLEALKQTLENENYEVVTALDGEEGLSKIRDLPCHLAIVDIILPQKEGVETIADLKRYYGETIKILAISGGGEIEAETYLQLAMRMGADATLDKPFHMDELKDKIDQLIGDKTT